MVETCNQCGNEYKRIGMHWSTGSCDHPSLTDRQREIITGFVMGDGSINTGSKNPALQSIMITKEFLEWINGEMGIFGNGLSLWKTAEELVEMNRESGVGTFADTAKVENYHDAYQWRSMCHPELQEFADWYETGKKLWPDSIELTPLTLKILYCCDGTLNGNNMVIYMSNESKYKEKVEKLFEVVDVEGRWYEHSYESNDNRIQCQYYLDPEESKRAFEYIGDPLPGFDYKWPDWY